MRVARALVLALAALAAAPAWAPAHDGETHGRPGSRGAEADDRPGPSPAQLRERTRHRRVGGRPAYRLSNRCLALRSKLNGQLVAQQDDGSYSASVTELDDAEPFRMQATALGSYLLYGPDRDFLAIDSDDDVRSDDEPSNRADWEAAIGRQRGYMFFSRAAGKVLAVSDSGELRPAERQGVGEAGRFTFEDAGDRCARYPEAEVNAEGKPFKGTNGQGEVVGYLEAHVHFMFHQAVGGQFHCGRPWHRFGVEYALPDCEYIEGPEGSAAPVQNYLNYGNPVAPHDTRGWPVFESWPGPHKLTYEGMYHKWLERAWRGGLRVFVALNTDNKAICEAYTTSSPRPGQHGCNEMDSVRRQIADVYELQDYIDAQNRGPGRGWFRIVKNPAQARRVIKQGKLAVILGIETSIPLDCGVFNEVPQCDEQQIDVELQRVHDMGVRQMELINKFDNAFGGVAGDSGTTGVIVNQGNFKETGRYWDMDTCETEAHDRPQPSHSDIGIAFRALVEAGLLPGGTVPVYPPPPHCNQLGFSSLGRHMLKRMMGRGMVIDPDHLGVIARRQALDFVEEKGYPGLISSHSWADVEAYPRIHKLGGLVTPYAGDSSSFVEEWRYQRKLRRKDRFYGIGYGSDMHGLGPQGDPREGDDPVEYPFKASVGKVKLDRQVAGDRTFDINEDGVAQYGMYPDWIEDLRKIAGDQIIRDMSRGAEAYLRMWERATRRSQALHTLGR